MRDQELVNALRYLCPGNFTCARCEYEPVCHGDGCAIIQKAADRLENQNAHIAALQMEIEKLRGQNEQLREAAALVAKESAELLERRWIPVEENLYPADANLAGGCGGGNPRQVIAYVTNPDAPRNCCAGGFDSTKIGEEAE